MAPRYDRTRPPSCRPVGFRFRPARPSAIPAAASREADSMRRISTGSWAYNTGPYAQRPIPFETVLGTLAELKFAGLELGGVGAHPGPAPYPTPDDPDRPGAPLGPHRPAPSPLLPPLGRAPPLAPP